MELRFSPLFSGSSGNATYVGCDSAHILVDAGLSGSRVTGELQRVGVDPASLTAILVTHEHTDHTLGLYSITKNLSVSIYSSKETLEFLVSKKYY